MTGRGVAQEVTSSLFCSQMSFPVSLLYAASFESPHTIEMGGAFEVEFVPDYDGGGVESVV